MVNSNYSHWQIQKGDYIREKDEFQDKYEGKTKSQKIIKLIMIAAGSSFALLLILIILILVSRFN